MAIGTGQVSLSDIQTEYGGSNPIQLSEYYSKGNAPASGEIQLWADFQGTSADAHTFISSQTASASSSLSFTSGIDSTYDVYEFHFVNCHPATAGARLTFQMDSGSGYATTMTTTNFLAENAENNSGAALVYRTIRDQAQGTSYQPITGNIWNNSDDSGSGVLTVYQPSSSTYVKHFTSVASVSGNGFADSNYVAGYFNTTSALTRIDFKMSSGNIDAGEVRMYGVATS